MTVTGNKWLRKGGQIDGGVFLPNLLRPNISTQAVYVLLVCGNIHRIYAHSKSSIIGTIYQLIRVQMVLVTVPLIRGLLIAGRTCAPMVRLKAD